MKTTYAQNKEDIFVLEYFKSFKGTLLEIGANDGSFFSNSKLLIENGWTAHLVEPASVFRDLKRMYADNADVHCYNMAISDKMGLATFYESGEHTVGGKDKALVSSLDKAETERWLKNGVVFEEKQVATLPFNKFWELTDFAKFHFISIDAEGFDWLILKQIDLAAVNCCCLCIEFNGDQNLLNNYVEYCKSFGLQMAIFNAENIIFIKS